MSRLERKCVIGSAAFHGLLLVIFIFGSAFIGPKPEKSMQAITIIDLGGKMTDQKNFNGRFAERQPHSTASKSRATSTTASSKAC